MFGASPSFLLIKFAYELPDAYTQTHIHTGCTIHLLVPLVCTAACSRLCNSARRQGCLTGFACKSFRPYDLRCCAWCACNWCDKNPWSWCCRRPPWNAPGARVRCVLRPDHPMDKIQAAAPPQALRGYGSLCSCPICVHNLFAQSDSWLFCGHRLVKEQALADIHQFGSAEW